MSVEWFKKRAKEITKAMRNGDAEIARTIGIKEPFNASLMVVQHCLVKTAGFSSWATMLHADDDAQRQGVARVKLLLTDKEKEQK